MRLKTLEVSLASDLRVDETFGTGFGIAEVGGFFEGEVDLSAIHEVEEHEVVPHRTEEGELLFQVLDGGEEIGDEADHAAFAQQIGELADGEIERGACGLGGAFQLGDEASQMAGTIARRHVFLDSIGKRGQTGCIALLHEEGGERGSECGGVIGLREAL